MKIKIGFFAILLCLSLLISHSLFSIAAFFAALTHELGHILMAHIYGIRLKECSVGLYGAGIVPDDTVFSYKKEILLCLGGPMVNFILGGLGIWFKLYTYAEFFYFFIFSSFSFGVLNSLPIQGFDGGRILYALLSLFCSQRIAERILTALSFCLIFLLWCFSVYLLLRASESLSLFIFSLSLFSRIFIREK